MERWDGTGYPDGLKGLDIPLFSRIVSIADVWDALTSDRPYRKAYKPEIALGVMNAMSNHFDPRLYTIFLRKLREVK
jgi:HD-GYP domain-containing protein (c-di-GMP phosphodiesterase class II)